MTHRGALIGCGYISEQQLRAWGQIEAAEIVAVCDIDEAKARQRAQEFGIPAVYTDYRQMLDSEELDFVDIATRPAVHLEMVRAGAERGLNVLCQKPVAGSLDEARAMIAACREAGVLFMVNENARHQAWFRQVRELLEAGALGQPYNARFHNRWRSTLPTPNFEGQPFFQDMPRLIVFEAEIHMLDTARYLFGEAQTIYARLRRVSPHIAGEDKALIIADFGELTCLLDSNWYAVPEPGPAGVTWGSLVVEGTEGTAVLDRRGALALYTGGEPQVWKFPPDTIPQSFVAAQRHFIECLDSGAEPETSGPQTLRTMALVFGAYRSAAEGRVVHLDEFEVA
jgi:predicted dehydrogenase